MAGRLKDAWEFVWTDVWLALEASDLWPKLSEDLGYTIDQLYMDLYMELSKALKKAPRPEVYDTTANDPTLARKAVETTDASLLRSESAIAQFFENAFDAISEAGSPELENEYRELTRRFLRSRNLRYELAEPFRFYSHVPGAFAALFSDLEDSAQRDAHVNQALLDFQHAFQALERSHAEVDAKTCILKATMFVEALASAAPGAHGNTLAELCNSLQCWPHASIREAVKRVYGFCSDYPGIRHNVANAGRLRALDTHDSVIVPLLLLTAAGYFGSRSNLLETLRSQSADPKQEPPDPPVSNPAAEQAQLP
jgi:hypothetical protein